MLPEFLVVERDDDGLGDVDGGDRAEPARQVLFGRRRVDRPRLFPVADAQIGSAPRPRTSCI